MAAAALLIFTIAFLKDGASGIQVDVSPRDPTVRVGQNFTFMCRVAKPLMYCRIEIPGSTIGLNMNEKVPKTSDYWYAGEGIGYGQCGITISRMTDKQNGRFKCSLGFSDEQKESEGATIVTVARPPQNRPELTITPEVDPRFGTYSEGTTIKAMCTVTDARPAANLLWFMGDDQIMDGVGRPEIVESPTDLFTVHQNLTRRLTWRDNRKVLKCVATHIALDGEMKPTVIQISVRFAPRPIDGTVEQFGFIVGEEGVISVQIHANPKPKLTWVIDRDSFPEGSMDITQRFEATSARDMGNGTWEAQLRIMRVTAEDVDKNYVLRARNDVGEQQYTVRISTSAEPQGSLELGTGPIIGIVVAILVLLIIIFMVIFARATGRWCFSGFCV